ncbi:MAG: hypothetical protein NTU88_15735 [Armatimonadetes bacterium]|nr:hypothetical protein [Armatimonadota bacterium]
MKSEDQTIPAHPPRSNWEAAFEEMAECGEDRLLDEMTPTDWDTEEWDW